MEANRAAASRPKTQSSETQDVRAQLRAQTPEFVTHPAAYYEADARTMARHALQGSRASMGPGAQGQGQAKAVRGTWAHTWSKLDIFNTADQAWADKPIHAKIANTIQVPVRFLLVCSTPVVYHADREIAWDRKLHMIM